MYANFTFIFSLADIFCASVFLYTLAIHDSVFSVSQSGLIHSKCCFTQKSLRKKKIVKQKIIIKKIIQLNKNNIFLYFVIRCFIRKNKMKYFYLILVFSYIIIFIIYYY